MWVNNDVVLFYRRLPRVTNMLKKQQGNPGEQDQDSNSSFGKEVN